MSVLELSEGQERTLVMINIFNLVFYSMAFILALHNAVRYICKLQIKRWLIVFFYILTFGLLFTRMIETITRVLKPQMSYFNYNISDAKVH